MFSRNRLILIGLLMLTALTPALQPAPASAASTWRYTALGDSIAFGLWSSKGYVPRYRTFIANDTHVSVRLTNLAVNGWTTDDLLHALNSNPMFATALTPARVITFDIGGNDFLHARDSYRAQTCGGADNQDCLRGAAAHFKSNYSAITLKILTFRKTSNTIIRTMDLYNPFVAVDQATDTWPNDQGSDFLVYKPYFDDINDYIATTAVSNHLLYAQVYVAFNGASGAEDPRVKGYIAFDGLHPNDKGHTIIAQAFRKLGYKPLK